MTADGTSLAFEYNADGLRWKKTGGGATHLYGYRGTKLISDKTGTDTLLFRYDTQGNILGFTQVTASSTEHYTYVKNLQGDILGILNSSGQEVASYTYDAWGRVLSVTGSDLSLAERNPIRYRGYYYDSESQLYYLQSRYYDPELKRFISPDSYAQTYDSAVGANMFAYCGNEPVNKDDSSGHSPILAGLIVLAAVSLLSGCSSKKEKEYKEMSSKSAGCYQYALSYLNFYDFTTTNPGGYAERKSSNLTESNQGHSPYYDYDSIVENVSNDLIALGHSFQI